MTENAIRERVAQLERRADYDAGERKGMREDIYNLRENSAVARSVAEDLKVDFNEFKIDVSKDMNAVRVAFRWATVTFGGMALTIIGFILQRSVG